MDIRNLWKQQPVAIAEAVKAVLYALVLLGFVAMSADQLAAIGLALAAVLGLLVQRAVDSPATAQQKDATIASLQAALSAATSGKVGVVGNPAEDPTLGLPPDTGEPQG
jgi:hypothetical protein